MNTNDHVPSNGTPVPHPSPEGGQPQQGGAWKAPEPSAHTVPNQHVPAQPVPTQPQQPGQPGQPQQPVQPGQSPYAQPVGQAHPQHAPHQPHVAQQPVPSAPKKSGGGAKTFLLAFLGAALAVAIGLGGFGIYNAVTGSGSAPTQIGSSSSSTIDATDTDTTLPEAVAQKALPSVANIDVYTSQGATDMFGNGASSDELTESSLGSGVVLTDDGYIVTNYHVIAGSQALVVTIDGEEYNASVVGADESSDIAVIKAENASGLTPIEIGSSADLIIGEWVMTIGSPFGLEQSVATGIVSATSRSQIMEDEAGGYSIYTNLIQTDAAINPGNSGGALVDSDGKLIGINTLITSYSGNYSGVGFAIPVDYAVNIADQIMQGKTPTHAQLGVSLATVTPSLAQRYGLPVDQGAYVTQVYPGTGAESAGLQVGDIITSFNGQAVTSASDLMLDIRSMNPGDSVSLEVNRDGQTQTMNVTLGSDQDETTGGTQQNAYRFGGQYGGGAQAAA